MSEPRVTVIIPVYNGEAFVAQAVESVLAQTEPVRLIVVDDGSTDGTFDIMTRQKEHPNYKSISFDDNRGAASALNTGLRLVTTEFVAWLSHDDVFMPEKIERQLEAIGDADACYTNFDIIDADGALVEHVRVEPPPPADMFRQIIVRNIINGSSMLLRRDVFERIGFFREDLTVDVDGEMWLRMIGAGMSFVHVPESLLQYRRHGGQLSANRELMRRTKDAVRALAIERTPPERAFPESVAAYGETGWSNRYRSLSREMSRQGLTLAAAAARHKSLDVLESIEVKP